MNIRIFAHPNETTRLINLEAHALTLLDQDQDCLIVSDSSDEILSRLRLDGFSIISHRRMRNIVVPPHTTVLIDAIDTKRLVQNSLTKVKTIAERSLASYTILR